MVIEKCKCAYPQPITLDPPYQDNWFCGSCGLWGGYYSISMNLSREQLFELGRKTPYYKFVNFPVEVDSGTIQLAE